MLNEQKSPLPVIGLSDIEEQAKKILDIAQRIIDTCRSEEGINRYARAKATSGGLAGDVATLGIMIVAYEYQENRSL